MNKEQQKHLLTEVMNADAKDGLYKKQTAVEWFYVNLKALHEACYDTDEAINILYEKAKQMEKEQKENDWINGGKAGYNAATGKDFKTFQEYYKENYGTE